MAAFGGRARADNLAPACTANTLSFYMQSVNSGSPCSVGILNFATFSFLSGGSSAPLDTAADIEVTPNGPGGFTFSQVNGLAFSVLSGTNATYDIGYDFVIDAGPVSTGSSLDMDPPSGTVSIDEFFCPDSGLSLNIQARPDVTATPFCTADQPFSPQDLHVDDTAPPVSWSTGIVALNPPAFYGGSVLTRIQLDGGISGAGFDRAGETFFTTDPSAPEPSTIVLVLSGLGTMGLRRRSSGSRKPA